MFCAAVDYKTDGKIQNTIMTEFKERTILCIAHKFHCHSYFTFVNHCVDCLCTIISYDRICVLNAGMVAVCIPWLFHWSAC